MAVRTRAGSSETLAGIQLALALVLVLVTALLVRSLIARFDVPIGMQTKDVAVVRTVLGEAAELTNARSQFYRENNMDPRVSYGPREHLGLMEKMRKNLEPQERAQNKRDYLFFRETERRLRSLVGVLAVGTLQPAPMTPAATRASQVPDWVSARRLGGGAERGPFVSAIVGRASPEAFQVLGIPVVEGRPFSPLDVTAEFVTQESIQFSSLAERPNYRGVAIVNDALAKRLWPKESALGKELFDRGLTVRTVVGVVSNFQQTGYNIDPMPAAYYPSTGLRTGATFILKLQEGTALEQFRPLATQALSEDVPESARSEVQTMQGIADSALANLRMAVVLLGGFAFVGTTVAGLGVYASAIVLVAARKHELAVRVALGAQVGQLRWWGVRRSARLALTAISTGLLVGWVVATQLSAVVFQVRPLDLVAYAVSAAILLLVSVTAGTVPVWRAANVDPASALRAD